jgi:hypothetical protein
MTKHVHMSPPPRREHSEHERPKLFRLVLAFLVFGWAVVWAGSSGRGEAPIAKLASTLSDRWDQSMAKAPHVLPPLLGHSEAMRSKSGIAEMGALGSQAAPALGARSRGARKTP